MFYYQKCFETHIPQSRISKILPGVTPPDNTPGPPLQGEGREGEVRDSSPQILEGVYAYGCSVTVLL